jgi:hypothetical protein
MTMETYEMTEAELIEATEFIRYFKIWHPEVHTAMGGILTPETLRFLCAPCQGSC